MQAGYPVNPTPIEELAENVWLVSFPLTRLGVDIRRNVTILRLANNQLVIHSTGPFSAADVAGIRERGRPAWLVDAMLRHDTFSRDALTAFPGVPYLAPEGFADVISYPTQRLLPPPSEWAGQLEMLELRGVPSMRETVAFHVPSRTLIVADLAMNIPGDHPAWQEFLIKIAVGRHHAPGISRAFKIMVKDESALKDSLAQMMKWDFDRLIVGHGSPILANAKRQLSQALVEAKLFHP